MLKTSSIAIKALDNIVKDLFDIFIFHILNTSPKSGYEIKKQLSRLFGVAISYGTLYPHLHSLEKKDLINGEWVPNKRNQMLRKREYTLTPTGREVLRTSIEVLSKVTLTLQIGIHQKLETLGEISHRPLDRLVILLEKEGYATKKGARITGSSGSDHEIDVFGSKFEKGDEKRIIVGITESEQEVSVSEVVKFYLKANDVKANRLIFLACPRFDERARKIADLCNIEAFEGEDLELAVQKFENSLLT